MNTSKLSRFSQDRVSPSPHLESYGWVNKKLFSEQYIWMKNSPDVHTAAVTKHWQACWNWHVKRNTIRREDYLTSNYVTIKHYTGAITNDVSDYVNVLVRIAHIICNHSYTTNHNSCKAKYRVV
jgi:hypothetical protein